VEVGEAEGSAAAAGMVPGAAVGAAEARTEAGVAGVGVALAAAVHAAGALRNLAHANALNRVAAAEAGALEVLADALKWTARAGTAGAGGAHAGTAPAGIKLGIEEEAAAAATVAEEEEAVAGGGGGQIEVVGAERKPTAGDDGDGESEAAAAAAAEAEEEEEEVREDEDAEATEAAAEGTVDQTSAKVAGQRRQLAFLAAAALINLAHDNVDNQHRIRSLGVAPHVKRLLGREV